MIAEVASDGPLFPPMHCEEERLISAWPNQLQPQVIKPKNYDYRFDNATAPAFITARHIPIRARLANWPKLIIRVAAA
jgi:hypothetical protein